MMNALLKKIKNPDAEFRGAPFWAWNSKLDPQELRWQIRMMKEMGLGGFFMHSRVGLNTEYLGSEWFDCIRACTDEAKQLGMNAWLYDEDRWPSGAGGGIVTKDIRFRERHLRCEVKNEPDYQDSDLAWFAAEIKGKNAFHPRRLAKGETLPPGETFLRFYVEINEGNSWYNGETYLDTMNPEAVRKFIEITHDAYAKEIPSEFGKTVPGIFSDEPNCSNWTDGLPARFTEMYGYDILDFLPELFFNINGNPLSKVRLNYQNVRTDLFVNAFSKQIGEWCDKHNMQFTGHVLCEDNVVAQTNVVGAAMRFYEYMQAPGIDLLTEHWNIFNTAKQCVSMAHQFGRKTRLSETYGCTGWDFPFSGHKALGDWQLALGINLRCQHLAWYSMEAEAKRDYPASIFYQSPWYRQYPVVEDYFARINAALSEGEEIRNLLVVHPIESTWFGSCFEAMSSEEQHAEEQDLIRLTNLILKDNIDFDFGDEEIMSRHAKVSGDTLSIEKATYKAVLLPKLRTIRSSTLALLRKFTENGGIVAYLGNAPEYVDGNASVSAIEAYRTFVRADSDHPAKAVELKTREISVTENGTEINPVLYLLRRSNEFSVLFLCNTGMELLDEQMTAPLVRDRTLAFENASIAWNLPKEQNIYELDPKTGNIYSVESEYKDGKRIFKTSFAPLGSRLFLASGTNPVNAERSGEKKNFANTLPLPSKNWTAATDDYNVLVLDHPRYSADGSYYSIPEYIIKIDDRLREILGKNPRGGAMVQPWLRAKDRTPERTIDLKLLYEFECDAIPSELIFAVERPEFYSYELNGKALEAKELGFWCDHSMKKIALPVKDLKKGKNELILSCRYHELLPGLETAYLLGEFGEKNGKLSQKPNTLSMGDWCSQGFKNYAGNMIYSQTVRKPQTNESVYLEIPSWRGVALGVSVNGSKQVILPWPPYRTDVTNLLKDGENTIEIEVFGHRRNSHGPFYLHEKWPNWTGPYEFKGYQETERQLVPCGLLEAPVLKY